MKLQDIWEIPENMERGWEVFINGRRQKVGSIEISSRFGTLKYGKQPEGFDGWRFYEKGGGGATTLPYALTPEDEILIGLLKENRPNMGGEAWCIIGGFIKPDETHEEAQAREAEMEAGLVMQAPELPGLPANSNRLFFIADPEKGEGVHSYGVVIPFSWLEPAEGNSYRFKDIQQLPPTFKKKPENVRFFPWKEAIWVTADALAREAIARLLTTLF